MHPGGTSAEKKIMSDGGNDSEGGKDVLQTEQSLEKRVR